MNNTAQTTYTNEIFLEEAIKGLTAKNKFLPAKYFYNAKGDELFQQIMAAPEYYLTRCEMEIFEKQTTLLAEAVCGADAPFDLIELGVGDGTKTIHLLRELVGQGKDFRYLAVDISGNILAELGAEMQAGLPELPFLALKGEYLDMLDKASLLSAQPKVVMFLGSNIGNLLPEEALEFCRQLRAKLSTGDRVLIGFDLIKNPAIIRAAYDDKEGITKDFNLNLLSRMNEELESDFDLEQFEHYCSYDPSNGACKSFLVSLLDQEVSLSGRTILFRKDECIWMEISQKYAMEDIIELAERSGFQAITSFSDSRGWFSDVIWKAI